MFQWRGKMCVLFGTFDGSLATKSLFFPGRPRYVTAMFRKYAEESHLLTTNFVTNFFLFHDDVIKWKHFRVTGHLCGEFTGPGEFPAQRPVTRSFDVFFDLCLNKRLSKQSWGWWFETLSRSLWRHCNVFITNSSHLTRVPMS